MEVCDDRLLSDRPPSIALTIEMLKAIPAVKARPDIVVTLGTTAPAFECSEIQFVPEFACYERF
jgi:hypothetical protein